MSFFANTGSQSFRTSPHVLRLRFKLSPNASVLCTSRGDVRRNAADAPTTSGHGGSATALHGFTGSSLTVSEWCWGSRLAATDWISFSGLGLTISEGGWGSLLAAMESAGGIGEIGADGEL